MIFEYYSMEEKSFKIKINWSLEKLTQ